MQSIHIRVDYVVCLLMSLYWWVCFVKNYLKKIIHGKITNTIIRKHTISRPKIYCHILDGNEFDIWRRILRIFWHFSTLTLRNFLSGEWKNLKFLPWIVTLSRTYLETCSFFVHIHRCAVLKWIIRNMQFAVSRQEQFSFLELSNDGKDWRVDIIFNKMLGLNAIYSENINFFNATDKKLFRHKHWKCSWRDTNSQNSSPYE